MPFFDAPTAGEAILDPAGLVGACLERGTGLALFDEGALPPSFFDLSSGFAGELVQKLINYGIRAAVVVPDASRHSGPFQDFAREADRTGAIRIFVGRHEAEEWLRSIAPK